MRRRKSSIGTLSKLTFLFIIGFLAFSYQDKIKEYIKAWLYSDDIKVSYSMDNIPDYNGEDFVYLNNNIPLFTDEDYQKEIFEKYSDLDSFGRASVAFAHIGKELMPTEERGAIGMIKPSGWHTVKYDNISGKYLYNRCHLIGFQLTGENANEKNLITCTRQMNTVGMLEWENKVANYIKETGNTVLYRVTPIYKNYNLLASGVQIEASSVYDKGKDLSFNVYVFNVQDGIEINYENGESKLQTN